MPSEGTLRLPTTHQTKGSSTKNRTTTPQRIRSNLRMTTLRKLPTRFPPSLRTNPTNCPTS